MMKLISTMEAQLPFPIFIFAATPSRLIVHVVIIVLGVSPEWISRVVHNGPRFSAVTRGTRRNLRGTHDRIGLADTRDATMQVASDMVVMISCSYGARILSIGQNSVISADDIAAANLNSTVVPSP
jgi:hypothetical protein